jgi:hypothetical protein
MIKNYQTSSPSLVRSGYRDGKVGVGDEAYLFNINISVISWLSVLLVRQTGVPEENHRPVASH